jgi:hypothetical protein
MFDFIHQINRNRNCQLVSNKRHIDHLIDGTYVNYRVSGKGFSSEVFAHNDNPKAGYMNKDDLTIFLIGHTYTNYQYESASSEKPHELTPLDVLSLYSKYGPGFIKFLKGIFVIFIADEKKTAYYAYVSRSGLLKIFYHIDTEQILVSTSIASLLVNLPQCPAKDDVAIIQHGCFDYPLGSRTHFKGVVSLDNLSYLSVAEGLLSVVKYTSISERMITANYMSWNETRRLLPRQFNQVMDTIIPRGRFNSAITAGYDSRTVLSYIAKHGIGKCRLYSWGADERYYDVYIAKKVAESLSFGYTHVVLGDDMLKDYSFYAEQQIYWSDGMGSINRANQMYSHKLLSHYARDLLTGYFGSELLRPIHRLNVMVRAVFIDLLMAQNREQVLETYYEGFIKSSAFQTEYIKEHKNDFFHSVIEHMKELDIVEDNGIKVLHYLIRYGFWKFFGQEFHAQRIHTLMHSPFIDDDFVDFIVCSCVREVHQATYKRDPILLMKSQALYNPIIRENYPQLLEIQTNKGFSPSDFDSWMCPLNVLLKYHLYRVKKRKEATKGFFGYDWHKHAYVAAPNILNMNDKLFKNLDDSLIQDGKWFSLKKWLSVYSE